jgi:hypothetical protein
MRHLLAVTSLALVAFAASGCKGRDRDARSAADVGAESPPEAASTTQVTSGVGPSPGAGPTPGAGPSPGAGPTDLPPVGSPDVPAAAAERPFATADEQEEDRDLSTAIRQRLVRDESLAAAANRIQIVTRDGSVLLRGMLSSEADKERVLEEVKQVPGVLAVEEEIEVGTP